MDERHIFVINLSKRQQRAAKFIRYPLLNDEMDMIK